MPDLFGSLPTWASKRTFEPVRRPSHAASTPAVRSAWGLGGTRNTIGTMLSSSAAS